jgi:hypothetical protein
MFWVSCCHGAHAWPVACSTLELVEVFFGLSVVCGARILVYSIYVLGMHVVLTRGHPLPWVSHLAVRCCMVQLLLQ